MVRLHAPGATVAGLLRDTALLAAAGYRLPGRWLTEGDVLGGLTVRVLRPHAVEVACGQVHRLELVPFDGGTELRGPLPAGLVDVLVEALAELAERRVVVATALVRDGRVLAARRTRPPALAGRWELPGGRVEPGESEPDAVVRECREELGCAVTPTRRIGTDLRIDAGVLRVHAAVPAPGTQPVALEHSALRWVGPHELDAVDWVDADRAVLPDLRTLLDGG